MYPQLNTQPLNLLSTVQLLPLGTTVIDDQGRKKYRYVQFGGTSTVNAGLLVVAPAAPSNSTNLALASANTSANLTSGATTILVTNGATAVTANQFADGQLELIGANGVGQSYRIAGNTADSVGSATITVKLADPLRNTTALVVGTNTVNLRQNPSLNPVVSTTLAEAIGVTIMPVPNSASVTNYGWVQIAGDAVVQATTAVKGQAVTQDTAGTAGFLMSTATATSFAVGQVQESLANGLATVRLSIE